MTKVSSSVLVHLSIPHVVFFILNHRADTKEEDLTHPEDIAHFRKHDEMDAAAEYQERMDAMPIVEQNIPQKFRRY